VTRFRVPILGVAVVITTAFVVTGAGRWFTMVAVIAVSSAIAWWTTTVPVTDSEWSRWSWCIPELVAAAFAGALWHEWGGPGAVAFAVAALVVLLVAGAWGAPAWRSRFVGSWADARVGPHRRAALLLIAVLAIGGAAVAIADSTARGDAVLLAGVGAEGALAGAASAVRQWRFAPRRRLREGVVVTLAALASGAAAALLGQRYLDAQALTMALAAVIALVVAWPLDPTRFRAVNARATSGARASASSPDD
jgi:hypothetical protein